MGIVNAEFHSQQTQQLIMTLVKNLTNFPFAAIIGQDEMKLALQLNVIDPKIVCKRVISSLKVCSI